MKNIEAEISKILSRQTMQDTAYTLNSKGLKIELNNCIQEVLSDQKKEIRDWAEKNKIKEDMPIYGGQTFINYDDLIKFLEL